MTLRRLTESRPQLEKWRVSAALPRWAELKPKQTVPTFFLSLSAGPATPVMEKA